MSTTQTPEVMTCSNCGFTDHGKFCSNCGAELNYGSKGVVGVATQDVLGLSWKNNIVSIFLKILRSPVKNTIQLIEDVTYRGHRTFFIFSLGLFLLLSSFLASPEGDISAEELADKSGFLIDLIKRNFTELIYFYYFLWYVVLFVAGYFIFPFFAKASRSLSDYWKFSCLNSGFTILLMVIALLPALYYTIAQKLGSPFEGNVATAMALGILIPIIGCVLYILIYNIRVQRRFWDTSIVMSLAGVVASFFVSTLIMESLDLAVTAWILSL